MAETTPKNGVKKFMVFECFFAVMIVLLVSGYLFGITFLDIPKENSRVVDTVLGFILGSVISPIVIWAFKNSKATVDKQKEESTYHAESLTSIEPDESLIDKCPLKEEK